MPNLFKNGQLEANPWQRLEAGEARTPNGLVPLASFTPGDTALWLSTFDTLSPLADKLQGVATIGIYFPAFADGRGFSLAQQLRQTMGFTGELIALGHTMLDQLHYLQRCGFSAVEVPSDANAQLLVQLQNSLSTHYSAASDQPLPWFRR